MKSFLTLILFLTVFRGFLVSEILIPRSALEFSIGIKEPFAVTLESRDGRTVDGTVVDIGFIEGAIGTVTLVRHEDGVRFEIPATQLSEASLVTLRTSCARRRSILFVGDRLTGRQMKVIDAFLAGETLDPIDLELAFLRDQRRDLRNEEEKLEEARSRLIRQLASASAQDERIRNTILTHLRGTEYRLRETRKTLSLVEYQIEQLERRKREFAEMEAKAAARR